MATDERELWMPAFGLIEGGRLHGWRFAFVRFVARRVSEDWQFDVEVRVTPPGWPFSRVLVLKPDYYKTLCAVPGERARRWRAVPLMKAAMEMAQ